MSLICLQKVPLFRSDLLYLARDRKKLRLELQKFQSSDTVTFEGKEVFARTSINSLVISNEVLEKSDETDNSEELELSLNKILISYKQVSVLFSSFPKRFRGWLLAVIFQIVSKDCPTDDL
ncbi:bacteriocin-protection protein [Striga asiatica]|uniref:Bacteriocin-protection protein n=1 Tax=Striga asiatica TaxID=4170 RepID=A0A5A7PE20_STRAF|nr:bacteriocin-protection protein [Striga asiatica]